MCILKICSVSMYFCPDLVENYAKNSMKHARQKLIEECRYNLGPYRVLKMCLNKQFSPSPYFLCQCKSLSPGPHLCKASDRLPSYTPQSHRFTFKDKYLTLQTMTPSFLLAIDLNSKLSPAPWKLVSAVELLSLESC